MKTTALFCTIAALASSSVAQAGSEPPKAYELKNRSAFNVDSDARIPFWPIGFVRPQMLPGGTVAVPVAATTKIQLEAGHFNVTSILLGNPALATINGRSFEEGELLPVFCGSERLRVVVRAIRDGGVALEYEGQVITVPMKRAELGARHVKQDAVAPAFVIQIGAGARK